MAANSAPARGSPRRRRSAFDVADELREDILSLALPPGTVLSRQALQARFGLSSTPIRDALLALQEEGLVEVFPQHATRITRIDLGLAREAQFLRRSIEMEAAGLLAAAPDESLVARLRALIARQEIFAQAGDLESFERSDRAFHHTLYMAADVPGLWPLVRRHSGQLDRLRRMHLPVEGRGSGIVAEHRAIVDAIAAGDSEAARAQTRRHLSQSLAFSEALRVRFPDYFTA